VEGGKIQKCENQGKKGIKGLESASMGGKEGKTALGVLSFLLRGGKALENVLLDIRTRL